MPKNVSKRLKLPFFIIMLSAVILAGGIIRLAGSADAETESAVPLAMPEITLRHTQTEDEETEQISLEEAVVGFVAAEMPAGFGEEALKAQAVAARSYVYCRSLTAGEVCDDSAHCLAYLSDEERRERWGSSFTEYEGKIRQAVNDTAGQIITVNGEPVTAYFHAVCGGMTETAAACWGGASPYPSAKCYWDGGAAGSVSSRFFPRADLAAALNVSEDDLPLLRITATTASGRVSRVTCGDSFWSGTEFRALLGLNSNNFSWLSTNEGYWFTTLGYGHGVGLCQQGAGGLAATGYNYRQILSVYYAGCEIGSYAEQTN
jgi:stage II sporulation protein D